MYDALLISQASQTVTNSATGTALDLHTGTPRRGMKMRFVFTAVSNASGSSTITPIVEHSDDNTNWYTQVSGVPIVTTTTNAPQEHFLSFDTSKRYVRASVVFSATTGTPTCTYHAELGTARP